MRTYKQLKRIGIVGPCTAGKSTLVHRLKLQGIEARHIAQEHSYVKDMWQRLTRPDVLIFLEVSYETSLKRRKQAWEREEYEEQIHRLRHAREHADYCINTDLHTPEQVFDSLIEFLIRSDSIRVVNMDLNDKISPYS